MEQLTDVQKQILEGHLLGDGCLHIHSISGKNAGFSMSRKLEDENYLLWTASNFKNFITPNGIGTHSCNSKHTSP